MNNLRTYEEFGWGKPKPLEISISNLIKDIKSNFDISRLNYKKEKYRRADGLNHTGNCFPQVIHSLTFLTHCYCRLNLNIFSPNIELLNEKECPTLV